MLRKLVNLSLNFIFNKCMMIHFLALHLMMLIEWTVNCIHIHLYYSDINAHTYFPCTINSECIHHILVWYYSYRFYVMIFSPWDAISITQLNTIGTVTMNIHKTFTTFKQFRCNMSSYDIITIVLKFNIFQTERFRLSSFAHIYIHMYICAHVRRAYGITW